MEKMTQTEDSIFPSLLDKKLNIEKTIYCIFTE